MRHLGKITSAFFGTIPDHPYLFGLQLSFSMGDEGCVGDGGKYTVNISKSCKWSNPESRSKALEDMLDKVHQILQDAKVNYVADLVNKPVEVTLADGRFKDFRILTEVL